MRPAWNVTIAGRVTALNSWVGEISTAACNLALGSAGVVPRSSGWHVPTLSITGPLANLDERAVVAFVVLPNHHHEHPVRDPGL